MKVNANLSFGAAIGLVLLIVVAMLMKTEQLPLLLGFVAPWIATLFAAAGLTRDVQDVKKIANGNYSKLVERNRFLMQMLVSKGLTPEEIERTFAQNTDDTEGENT